MLDQFNPFSLEGKTILVTGASSGIGRSVSVMTSKLGGRVILNGRNKEKLEQTLKLMSNGNHQICIGDLTKRDEIQSLVDSLPRLDGIVHCAGLGHSKICKQITEEDVNLVMDTNFKAPVLLQSEILQSKKLNKSASIVFIASLAHDYPFIGNALYSASKGAFISYSNCLKLELAPRKIRVNCISPGMVWTDLLYQAGFSDDELKRDEETSLLKRYGQPEDVAYLAIYLLSDASSWMTGTNILLTGGAPRL